MGEIVRLETEVPFGRALNAWLTVNTLQLDKLVQRDQMEGHYLAWETVRKQTNPFFQEGTGFEGYLIGRYSDPEGALEAILAVNQHILDAIARLYRFEYGFRSRLMKTLTRETSDTDAIHIWSGYLGAELGKLRVQIVSNPKAEAFHTQTYTIVSTLPPMSYHQLANDVTQTYAVGSASSAQQDKLYVTWKLLKPSQQDAWRVAENIGEFGHPLVRKLLDHA